jgi:hypothetical protein
MTAHKFNAKTSEALHQKLSIIKSMAGTDIDTALTVLTYALAETALANGAEFHSLAKNLALIWEHVESQLEAEEDGDANH